MGSTVNVTVERSADVLVMVLMIEAFRVTVEVVVVPSSVNVYVAFSRPALIYTVVALPLSVEMIVEIGAWIVTVSVMIDAFVEEIVEVTMRVSGSEVKVTVAYRIIILQFTHGKGCIPRFHVQ